MQLRNIHIGLLCGFMLSAMAHATLPIHDNMGKPLPSLAPMLDQVSPAVVNIAIHSMQSEAANPLLNDPFFRHFFNMPGQRPMQKPRKKRQHSAGSGVIVDADQGLVMTNYHVVKGADEIWVSLIDGRSFSATVRGFDPELDIALLDIDANQLTAITMGHSDDLRVGDFVIAIGNPFGLGQTVTTGVVSALGRTGLGIEGYENFIQTDASINPGNSGGALVDLHGHLVGINVAILAPAGGNIGIGFAIPINMAKASMLQILKYGKVKRGQLGIGIQDMTPDLRQAFELENGQRGVLITSVNDDSPAQAAKLQPGDIIIAVDDESTDSTGQLRSQIAMKTIGDAVTLTMIRDHKTKPIQVKVKVGEPQQLVVPKGLLHNLLEGAQFENNPDGEGVVVVRLAPNSTAAYSGLRPGDIIVGANKRRIDDMRSFEKALKQDKKVVLLHISRNGHLLYLVIR